ncbi:hypothetical protein GGD81_004082 [Rhodobium orientis]|uniref:Uncharacterized protein n=1 Tax=Rhodobium orientis TaxID=34017 RepID=A0A327JK56_9HYPH|nr:hypothetical protein [Rhodobium orientis]MBB4305016.1 hypothetical protein [Rhodobium orientis]MBK5948777.1 hypothetical protein [Rhodobium orientis]RAI26461.1 hypothetical protein CH339_14105 [Rhodobium orientis]
MAKRPRHPDKHIESAVQYAEEAGWRVEKRSGHCWGRLFCARADSSGCMASVWCTPKNPQNHAKAIMRLVDKCTCDETDDPE